MPARPTFDPRLVELVLDGLLLGRIGLTGLIVSLPLSPLLAGAAAAQEGDGQTTEAVVPAAALLATPLNGDGSVQLDGRVDEAVWSSAPAIIDFVQQEPIEGGTPSQSTEIRVLFDEDYLYIGAILYDDPSGILAYQKRRDASLGTDDRFMMILDTFLDGRTGYFFEINPAGLMGDGLIGGGGGGGGRGGRGGGPRGRGGSGG